MKDPLVSEIRRHRMEHTLQFDSNLHLICEDLRKVEATIGNRLVKPEAKWVSLNSYDKETNNKEQTAA